MIIFYFKTLSIEPKNVILSCIFISVAFLFTYLTNKKTNPKDFYYREIPESPALLTYYDKGKITSKALWITLLNLIDKKYLSLERQNKELIITNTELSFQTNNLKSYERN